MRENKYRGIDPMTDKWLYGSLVQPHPGKTEAIWHLVEGQGNQIHMIKPGTSGQYTGLKDRNGKEIYEGDVVKVEGHPFEGSISVNGNYEVGYNEMMELCCGSWLLFRMKNYCEVIGNIHDNSELLEEKG